MHKIDGRHATPDGRFTGGSPHTEPPIPATHLTPDWLNAVQDEILGVLESANIKPSKDQNSQLAKAITKIIQGALEPYHVAIMVLAKRALQGSKYEIDRDAYKAAQEAYRSNTRAF